MSDKDELERQRLEAWYSQNYRIPASFLQRHDKSDDYCDKQIRAAWRAWKAALSSKQEEA